MPVVVDGDVFVVVEEDVAVAVPVVLDVIAAAVMLRLSGVDDDKTLLETVVSASRPPAHVKPSPDDGARQVQ